MINLWLSTNYNKIYTLYYWIIGGRVMCSYSRRIGVAAPPLPVAALWAAVSGVSEASASQSIAAPAPNPTLADPKPQAVVWWWWPGEDCLWYWLAPQICTCNLSYLEPACRCKRWPNLSNNKQISDKECRLKEVKTSCKILKIMSEGITWMYYTTITIISLCHS